MMQWNDHHRLEPPYLGVYGLDKYMSQGRLLDASIVYPILY